MKLQTFTFGICLSVAIFLFAQHKDPNATAASMSTANYAAVLDLTHESQVATRQSSGREMTTHMVAPGQFNKDSWTIDQIPARNLSGALVVINVRKKAMKDADYELSMDDVAAWEKENGRIPDGAIVMAATGWSEKWRAADKYRGADSRGNSHFPGFSLEAVKFLVEARNVPGIGIDTIAVDPGRSEEKPVRAYTSAHNVFHIENVADLTVAPEKGATVVAAPARVRGASEAAVRVLVFVPTTTPAIQSGD